MEELANLSAILPAGWDNASVYYNVSGAEAGVGGGPAPGPPMEAGTMRLQYHVRTLDLYVTPTVLALGAFANLLTAALMARKPLSKTLCSVYFLAIVVANEVFLLMRLHEWLTEMGFSLYGIIGGWCQFTTFANKASDFLSLWYVVCLAADRYFHTWRPERHAELSSTWRARLLVIGLAIISTVIFLNTSLTVGVIYIPSPLRRPYCHTLPMFLKTMARLSHADVVVNAMLGLGCLLALAGLILVQKAQALREDVEFWVRKRRSGARIHRHHPAQPQTSSTSSSCDVHQDYDVTTGQTTASIVYIVVFLMFNLPLQGYRVREMFKVLVTASKPSVKSFLVMQILKFIKLINFSATFFVLLTFHTGFRRTLLRACALCCHVCSTRRTHTSIEMSGDERMGIESRNSKSSIEESSTVEFVTHESAYV